MLVFKKFPRSFVLMNEDNKYHKEFEKDGIYFPNSDTNIWCILGKVGYFYDDTYCFDSIVKDAFISKMQDKKIAVFEVDLSNTKKKIWYQQMTTLSNITKIHDQIGKPKGVVFLLNKKTRISDSSILLTAYIKDISESDYRQLSVDILSKSYKENNIFSKFIEYLKFYTSMQNIYSRRNIVDNDIYVYKSFDDMHFQKRGRNKHLKKTFTILDIETVEDVYYQKKLSHVGHLDEEMIDLGIPIITSREMTETEKKRYQIDEQENIDRERDKIDDIHISEMENEIYKEHGGKVSTNSPERIAYIGFYSTSYSELQQQINDKKFNICNAYKIYKSYHLAKKNLDFKFSLYNKSGERIQKLIDNCFIESFYRSYYTEINRKKILTLLNNLVDNQTSTDIYVYTINGAAFDHRLLLDFLIIHDIRGGPVASNYKIIVDKVFYVNSEIYSMTIEFTDKHERTFNIHFRDFTKLFPCSLKRGCEIFKISKRLKKFDNGLEIIKSFREKSKLNTAKEEDHCKIKEYLMADLISTAHVCYSFFQIMNSMNICLTKCLTAGKLSMLMLSRYIGNSGIMINQSIYIHTWMRKSYHGGRVLMFKLGINIDSIKSTVSKSQDSLHCLDVNSLYPSAMHKYKYPCGESILVKVPTIAYLNRLLFKDYKMFIAEVKLERIKDDIELSVIPTYFTDSEIKEINDKCDKAVRLTNATPTYYPKKFIKQVINSVDLKAMIKRGYKVIEVYQIVYWDQSKKMFSEAISSLYEKRQAYKRINSPVEKGFKLALNCMYGKFGTRIYSKRLKLGYIERGEKHASNNYTYYLDEKDFSQIKVEYPVEIASFITSYTRKIMDNYFEVAGYENIYYSDTDSLFVNKQGFKNLYDKRCISQKKLGLLKLEKTMISCLFMGPKAYISDVESKFKGVKDPSSISLNDALKLVCNSEPIKVKNTTFKKTLRSITIEEVNKTLSSIGMSLKTPNLKFNKWEWLKIE